MKMAQFDFVSSHAPQFCLKNRHGMAVTLSALGACLRQVSFPDCADNIQNIALSLAEESAYLTDPSFAGATVGPVAGRLKGAKLCLSQKCYPLCANDGANTLHGGHRNTARLVWEVAESSAQQVTFACTLPDGLEGFPGNRSLWVSYTLDDANTLMLRYRARTDQPTFLNLTNHTYWNLAGRFDRAATAQTLEIPADRVLYNNAQHLALREQPVAGTAFDFTAPRSVAAAMAADAENEQLRIANGYNNAFLLRRDADFCAALHSRESGIRLLMRTDYPALVFYSGGYLPVPGCALALEAQYLPGSVTPLLFPGEEYRHFISFTLRRDSE